MLLDTRHCRKCAFTNVAYVDPNMERIFEYNNLRFSSEMFCHISFGSYAKTLYHNCKLKLRTFKVGSKKYIWSFYKIHFIHIHLTKESYKHFPPLLVLHKKWFNDVECYRDWLLQMQICVLQCVLVKLILFIFLLRFAYGGFRCS